MFKQYQEIELTHEMLSDDLLGEVIPMKKGQHGVILEIYTRPGTPNGYDVEFFDSHHNTVAVMVVEAKDIKPRTKKANRSKSKV